MARLRSSLLLALSGVVLAYPEEASACEQRTICFNWTPTIIDNDVGEDFLIEDKFPARGTRVMLMRPVPEPPLHTFLDQEGCLTFESQYAYGHKLAVYGDAWVGDPPVHLRVARQEVYEGDYTTDFIWFVDVDEIAPNSVVEVTFEWEATDPIAPLMAVATELLHRFDDLQILPPPPTETLFVVLLNWSGGAGHLGYVPALQADAIYLGPDSYQEKYVIGHEMGHWLQAEWNAAFGGGSYKYGEDDDPIEDPVPDPPCKFFVNDAYALNGKDKIGTNAGTHGIRSAEWSRAALKEGFAHFIAAVALNHFADLENNVNEDGVFRYYKDIVTNNMDWTYYNDFVAANSIVSLLGGDETALGGENRWTENMCPNDWAEEGVSSEIDWLRFFWHFLTRSGTPPTLPQIFEFFAWVVSESYPMTETDVWCPLRLALSQSQWSSFVGRFDQANTDMGVYNGNAGTCP